MKTHKLEFMYTNNNNLSFKQMNCTSMNNYKIQLCYN